MYHIQMSVKIANIQGVMVLVLYCWSSEIICGPKQIMES